MTKFFTLAASAAVLALSTSAFAQTKEVPLKACPNQQLLNVGQDGNFQIPNSQVAWRDPVAAKQKSPTEWIMPDEKVIEAPIGYKVEVALAADCPLRYTYAALSPAKVSGGDAANVKGWPKRK
ncbi:MAG: hypothetical protein HYS26_04340 [Candidatus Kaiserbacteria bacterium]|nr:MAG: hypothetical protein HYS26_04340 [Candidatus Kaiserbacteria bacterium]